MSQFQILIQDLQATPIPVEENIGPYVKGLSYTTKDPGGCMDAEFSLILPPPLQAAFPIWARAHYRVYIIPPGEDPVWRGWINRLGIDFRGGAVRLTVHCIGIAALADQLGYQPAAPKNFAGDQTSVAMGEVIDDLVLAETITKAITASGFTIDAAAAVNFEGKARTALNFLAGFGNSSDVLYQWDFYPVGKTGTVTFTAAPHPSTPQYFIYLRDLDGWGFSSWEDGYANRVTVWYNNDASSVTVNDTAEQAAGPGGIGKVVEREIRSPAVVHLNDATQLGQVALEVYKKTIMVPTGPFTLPGQSPVWDEYSRPVPLYRLRAGRLVSLTDVRPADSVKNTLDWLNSFYIRSTRYNEDTQSCELQPAAENLVEPQIAQVYSILGGRYTV